MINDYKIIEEICKQIKLFTKKDFKEAINEVNKIYEVE